MKSLLLMILMCATAHASLEDTELQWAICEPSAESFINKMGFVSGALKDGHYQASYYETTDFSFFRQGVGLHVSEKSTKKSKLKIEFRNAADVDEKWMEDHDVRCEFDRYGAQTMPRCSMDRKFKDDDKKWDAEQVSYLRKYRPRLNMANLVQWGPYTGREFEFGSERGLDEMQVGQKTNPILEYSLRVPTKNSEQSYQDELQTMLARHIILCPQQVGKFERVTGVLEIQSQD